MKSMLVWNLIRESYVIIIFIWIFAALLLRKFKYYKHFITISFVIYLLTVLYITLLGRNIMNEREMELSFLWEYRLALKGDWYWVAQIINNMLLFLPMGFIYAESGKKSAWWKTVMIGGCVSFCIELTQLIFKLGLFEIDDIFNNTIGMLTGYWISTAFVRKKYGR